MKHVRDESVVAHVDALLHKAIEMGASDIHFEPIDNGLRIRFRIDGILYDQPIIEQHLKDQLLMRLKVLAHIDTAQKRIAQDGKFSIEYNKRPIDLRVSAFPCLHGQKMVVRILDRAKQPMHLDTLGLSKELHAHITHLITRMSGFFLVVGPTGSGKTTSLYAGLSLLNCPDKNIMTLEDPVEYYMDGITQSQVNPIAGFTFESGMRSLVRQDPDIIMVGEIRDKETARIAIQAALTGHMVLSTVHTSDAPSVIMRLMDMGIEPYLLNASLTGVLAQRLARTICTECKQQTEPTAEQLLILKQLGTADMPLYQGVGCNACNQTGFAGRTGIFQLLEMSHQLRSLLITHPHYDDLCEQALIDGMLPLLHDGIQKVRQGIIPLNELVRTIS